MSHTHLSWCPWHSEIKTIFGVLASAHFLLMFEKLTIMLAPDWILGVIFHSSQYKWARLCLTKGRLGTKRSKMAAVFAHERNSTSILVMSVSSCHEGHRSRQELNETPFCKFKCKKFCKFSRKSLLSSRSTGVCRHQGLGNLCSPEERKLKSDAAGKSLSIKR